MTRLLSLAAGVHAELDPANMVSVAASGGWPACGVWFDTTSWTQSTTREVRRRLDDSGVIALDLEPIIPAPLEHDQGERVIETAAEIGAHNVLFTSRLPELSSTAERFAQLCPVAQACGVRLVCEFLPIFPLATLDMALEVIADHPSTVAGLLIDNLHLARSDGSVTDLANIARDRLPYLQIADAPLHPPIGIEGLRNEALNTRQIPGEGELPIDDLLDAVPDVALSFEVRSINLHEQFPDPVDRARHLFERVRMYAHR